MTIKIYLNAVHDLSMSTSITAINTLEDGRCAIRLRASSFHPQGGGQKADRGRIGGAHVLHVAHNGPQVDHIVDTVEGLRVGDEVFIEVDPEWRRLNTVFHTAGHLIAGIIEREYTDIRAISGHQWPGEARVEFESQASTDHFDMDTINGRLADAVAAAWPVEILGQPFDDRRLQIGVLGAIACGGTHVRMLGEIQRVQVQGIKAKGGKVRISYTAAPSSVLG